MMSTITPKYLDLPERRVIAVDETVRLPKNKVVVKSPDSGFQEERFSFN